MNADETNKMKNKGPEGNPFGVPEGYFDNFASRLQDRISTEVRDKEVVLTHASSRLRSRLVPVMVLGSVTVLAVLFMFRWLSTPDLVIPTAQVSELIEYSSYNFDESQLVDALVSTGDPVNTSTEQNQILDYLSDQDLDLTDASIDL
jgi:hypothetical protein